jgi:hypothetical protein
MLEVIFAKEIMTPLNELFGIAHLSDMQTRSISPENVYGEKGRGGMADLTVQPQPEVERIGQMWDGPNAAARDLGRKFKVRPCITLKANILTTLMDVEGPGVIQHIWIALDPKKYRDVILRIFWDRETEASVEAPVGYFFCNGWNTPLNVLSIPINVNPKGGLNCYFPMPFRRHVKITLENRSPEPLPGLFYTVNYSVGAVAETAAYFHARFRRTHPLPFKDDHVILAGVRGKGHYVGTYLAWQQNSDGWWGEGEFKAYIDGDTEFPTICGTGTEDYFGGAFCFGENYSAPFMGYTDLTNSKEQRSTNKQGNRHGMYRFHILDPIRFQQNLKVTIQALGWRSEGRYLPLQDDICSVAYWYQTEPHFPQPPLQERDVLEVI